MNPKKVKERIEAGLSKVCTPSQKMFWNGFIVALADTSFITHREYKYLRDTIDLWRAGDTGSRMVTPDSMYHDN